MERDYSVVFWLNQPPKVEVGAYNYVSTNIKGDTIYVCSHDLPDDRKALGWDKISYGKAKLLILNSDYNTRKKQINNLLKRNNTYHILCGLRGSIADEICPILKRRKIHFFVVSERPSITYNTPKNIIHSLGVNILHRYRFLQYHKYVYGFLALGKLGVDSFHKIGWPLKDLYRFMYCGEYQCKSVEIDTNHRLNGRIKFLYVGRFKYKTHAVDVLQKAFDKQNNSNWQIDLAGGYGDDKDKVMRWIAHTKNAKFIGKIDASYVQNLMSSYDIILVPSRADGWNCQVNEALAIGTPVITTVESVSGELVEKINGGLVVRNASVNEFANAIEYILKHQEKIEEWKKNIENYNYLLSPETVGEYLLDIIDYATSSGSDASLDNKPPCPW